MDKEINVNLSWASLIKAMLVVLLFIAFYYIQDILLLVLTSVVIASSVEPLTVRLGKMKIPRVPAVIAVYAIFFAAFASIFYFFIPPLLDDLSGFLSSAPEYLGQLNFLPTGSDSTILGSKSLVSDFTDAEFTFKDLILDLRSALSGFSGGALQGASVVFGGITGFILIAVISFYLSVQDRGIENFLRVITPLKNEKYIIDLWNRTQKKIALWMQGQLILGLLIGVLVYIGLTVLGIKYALLLALLAAVLEIIPVFGPIISAVPAIILGFAGGGLPLALTVAAFYLIIQQFESHIIYPMVVRKVIGVPPLLVILSLIIFGKLFGFLGLILAVPIVSAVLEFADDMDKKKHRISE